MASCIQILYLFVFLGLARSQIEFPGNQGSRQSPRPSRPRENEDKFSGGGTLSFGSRHTKPSSPAKLRENACNCFESNSCPRNTGQARHGCLTEQHNQGICCVEQVGVTTRIRSFGSASPVSIPENIVTAGFEAGINIVNEIQKENAEMKRTGQYLKPRTPSRGHAYFFRRNPSAVSIHKQAYINARASAEISKMQQLTPDQAFVSLNDVSMTERLRRPCSTERLRNCDPSAKFRTIDGSCNNLQNPLFGKSETGFARLSPAQYEDGIMSPRSRSQVTGKRLPLVRDVSNTVLLDVNNPSSDLSLNVMQWAQFVDHDMTHAPFPDLDGEAIQCCENGKPVRNMPEGCFNIPIDRDDGFFSLFGQKCINFVRSMLSLRDKCSFGPAEQLNVLTHWLDGSMVYGSTEIEASRVRMGPNSPLLSVSNNDLPPIDPNLDCEARDRASCFIAGDSRINEQPGLTVMHTIWLREHNRIAQQLLKVKPQWSPERVFQEARRIVIAQIQHITFTEWLPLIVGPAAYRKYRLGAQTQYNPSINPAQFNEFATGAFRFGHSLVQGLYRLPSRSGRVSTLRLREVFNSPGLLQNSPDLVDSFVRGLTTQEMQSLDNFITEELSNHLFETRRQKFGMDLMSLNLQRGRDHAIANYNTIRRRFGVGTSNNFLDLRSTTDDSLIIRLQAAYENAEDIDLFVGGMTERRVRGGVLGLTFAEMVGLQFSNVRNADRFFYDVLNQPGSFNRAQLAEIKKSSMSRVFCDNSNIDGVQPNAFILPDRQRNRKVSCKSNDIPSINLNVWKK